MGPQGIATGGGVRAQLPDKWHFGGRNSAKGVHATEPARKNFVSAHCSREDVELDFAIENGSVAEFNKGRRPGISGSPSRYAYVALARVSEGSLQAGDWIEVVYGDRAGGSPGFVGSLFAARDETVLVAVDSEGKDHWKILEELPTLTTRAAPPVELRLTAPSNAVVGQPFPLHIALLDVAQNPTENVDGALELFVNRSQAEVSSQVLFEGDGPGWVRLEVTPKSEGTLRIGGRLSSGMLWGLSNPVKVTAEVPKRRVFWGDLHSHTQESWDGIGNSDASFRYARDVSALDFYARTDHSGDNLGEPDWETTRGLVDQFNDPGSFITLYAYECSFGAPYAHHNVYFRGLEGPLRAPIGRRSSIVGEPPRVTLQELWDLLRGGDAITIPHHTGCFSLPDWSRFQDDEMRLLIEIYSIHGTAEYFDPGHPLAYDQSDGRLHQIDGTAGAKDGPYYAQDLWDTGQRVGTIASSDDHRSQPGRPQMGLAAVFAPELTRDAVFDALRTRQAYGTTGERILLDFSVEGTAMGGEIETKGPPVISVKAEGTDQISLIEVLRSKAQSGTWRVIDQRRPMAEHVEFLLEDQTIHGEATYYHYSAA